MLGLGELYLRVERYGKAESSFRRALAAAPRDTRGHAGLGKVLQARQELPLAEPAFKKALSLDPGNLDALAGLAACYERRGLGARSDELLMRIAAAHPRDAAALARLANEYCSRSRWAEADSALEKALLLDPGSFPARRALAVCRFTQGRPADAEDALAAGLRLCPQRLLLRFALAQLQLSQGRTHDAERMYRSVLRSDPGNPDAYTGLGECLELRGEFDEAQAAFERSVALDPGDYRRSACLGTLLIRRGELYSAFKAYRAALRLAPDSWQTYFLLGLAYSMKPVRNLRAAEGMFRKALASNPGAAGPRVKLAESLLRRRRYAEAESLLGRWVASSPEDPTLKALLSRCCSEQGKRELAQRYAGSARAQRRASRTAMTRQNCRLLRDAVLGRGIRLVCVQYPMRNPRPLEDLFDDKTGIVFVDNEKSFQEAVQRSGYWDYFIDMFGGDFGHCTPKGYRLLAQNIADAILRALGEGHTTGLPGQ
jgi:tetratricopeptide (TPR) repeat protein